MRNYGFNINVGNACIFYKGWQLDGIKLANNKGYGKFIIKNI